MSMRRNLNAGRLQPRSHGNHWPLPGEPMTKAQAVTLKALAEEAGEPDAFDEAIGEAEASLRISALRAKIQHERLRAIRPSSRS
jgi:hypothetical protein